MDLLYVLTAERRVEAVNENHVDLKDGVNTLPLYVGKESAACDETNMVSVIIWEISESETPRRSPNDGAGSGGSCLVVLREKTRRTRWDVTRRKRNHRVVCLLHYSQFSQHKERSWSRQFQPLTPFKISTDWQRARFCSTWTDIYWGGLVQVKNMICASHDICFFLPFSTSSYGFFSFLFFFFFFFPILSTSFLLSACFVSMQTIPIRAAVTVCELVWWSDGLCLLTFHLSRLSSLAGSEREKNVHGVKHQCGTLSF